MKKYYEVKFSNNNTINRSVDSYDDEYSICIIAEHYPSIEEAAEFCKEDMEDFGYKYVVSVTELSRYDAHGFFDMRDEYNFPVLK